MTRTELEPLIQQALDTVLARDSFLFQVESSEWSVAHRLAVYLEQLFPGWDIDCEYNRQGDAIDIKRFARERKVRPDIIIHHRGKLELKHNLLVIEVKKDDSQPDYTKVSEYTAGLRGERRFQYMFGIALDLSATNPMTWFANGERMV